DRAGRRRPAMARPPHSRQCVTAASPSRTRHTRGCALNRLRDGPRDPRWADTYMGHRMGGNRTAGDPLWVRHLPGRLRTSVRQHGSGCWRGDADLAHCTATPLLAYAWSCVVATGGARANLVRRVSLAFPCVLLVWRSRIRWRNVGTVDVGPRRMDHQSRCCGRLVYWTRASDPHVQSDPARASVTRGGHGEPSATVTGVHIPPRRIVNRIA